MSKAIEPRKARIGQRLKALRQSQRPKVTQAKLAEAIGVEANTVWRWEKAQHPPEAEHLAALAKYFRVTEGYFVDEVPKGAEVTLSDLARGLARLEKRLGQPTEKVVPNHVLQKIWSLLPRAGPAIQYACLYLCSGLDQDAELMEENIRREVKVLRSHIPRSQYPKPSRE